MAHEYSSEIIYHFNCSECKNWWSYATTDLSEDAEYPISKKIYCPFCGHKDYSSKKDQFLS